MGLISVLWGIVAMVWMIVALIPVVGITNWLLIPFAAVGAIIAAIGIALSRPGHARPEQGRAGPQRPGDRGRGARLDLGGGVL